MRSSAQFRCEGWLVWTAAAEAGRSGVEVWLDEGLGIDARDIIKKKKEEKEREKEKEKEKEKKKKIEKKKKKDETKKARNKKEKRPQRGTPRDGSIN